MEANMSHVTGEVVFLIRQFLEEKKFKNAIRWLETDSGCYFNMKYFEDVVTNGEWDEVEKYLSVFTSYDDNAHSLEMFFEIKKQKYFEALDKSDYGKAVEMLRKELTVFSVTHDNDLTKMTLLLRFPNFRKSAEFSMYGDTEEAKSNVLGMLKMSIEENPLFRDKLQLPNTENSRLQRLINQSLKWQHHHCKNPKPHPGVQTLYVDHSCGQIYGAWAPSGVTTQLTLGGPKGLSAGDNTDYKSAQKRARYLRSVNELNNHPINILPPGQTHPHTSYSSDELPMTVVDELSYHSSVTTMDFHPLQQTLLLVGTNTGDIVMSEVGNRNMYAIERFKVKDIRKCSASLQDPTMSVNCVKWNSDGTVFGVAYSKSFVHVYYRREYFLCHQEIEAHVGYVSDLAFSHPNKQLCIITCGEDKAIRVWNAATGAMQYHLEGHEAPVYSVCPHHHKQNQFIISNSVDGKIKAWLYDKKGPRFTADAPGQSCTRMASSADGTRVFSCGTSKDGETHIVEWDILKGAVKRSYIGLGKQATGVVQFDTMNNRFLVAGDEFYIKFWDIENVNLFAATTAHGGSLASPRIHLSKEGILLAVSASDNTVIILGNKKGHHLVNQIRTLNHYRVMAPNVLKSPVIGAYGASGLSVAAKCGLVERDAPLNKRSHTWPLVNHSMTDEMAKSMVWKPEEMRKQPSLRFLRLPDTSSSAQITRLIYTNSGGAILALACNGLHELWKWHINEQNRDGKATVNILPELWQPANGRQMISDISKTKPEDAVACLALTNHDAFVISGSGGKVSMFNIETFTNEATFVPPPPAATFLPLHPQNCDILALGMEDSSILIYNTKTGEVKGKLEGHQDRVTGLAFSTVLNALVSSGADSQICVWSMEGWNSQASKAVHISSGRAPNPPRKNHVQFHQDQIHLLVFNENLIAVYEAPELKCIEQWFARDSTGSITCATYSCDSQSVYVAFKSGNIFVFSAALVPQCRISPKLYLTASLRTRVYPLSIAAHPSDPSQFALGLTDGGILVLTIS